VTTDLDLECLATWRDGSESYLYSRLTATTSAAPATDGDQYRCLVDAPVYWLIVPVAAAAAAAAVVVVVVLVVDKVYK